MAGTILLASRNPKKLLELRRILAMRLPHAEVIGLDDVDAYPETPETGRTFADNALLKAREGHRHTGLPTVADDSGLTVDALNGMPGIFSARWSGRHGDDEANLRLVLGQVADVPDERLTAAFVAAVAYVDDAGELTTEGYQVTSAELDSASKDAISHRGKALRGLADRLAAERAQYG
jgi:XTP/dITP diphosphohydrolase